MRKRLELFILQAKQIRIHNKEYEAAVADYGFELETVGITQADVPWLLTAFLQKWTVLTT